MNRYYTSVLCGWLVSLSWGAFAQVATVRGVVQDSAFNPLGEVLIQAGTNQTTTAADGFFELQLEPGSYDLTFSSDRYTNVLRPVNLQADDTLRMVATLRSDDPTLREIQILGDPKNTARIVPNLAKVDLRVARNVAVIRGLVQDTAYNLLADVAVRLGDTQATESKSDGFFELRIAPGSYDLTFASDTYSNVLRPVNLQANDTLRMVVTLRPNEPALQEVQISGDPEDAARIVPNLEKPDAPVARNVSIIRGVIQDTAYNLLADVAIQLGVTQGTVSEADGFFELRTAPGTYDLSFSHLEYTNKVRQISIAPNDTLRMAVTLRRDTQILEEVEIFGNREEAARAIPSLVRLDPQAAQDIPSPFGDFTRVLATLPGVVSNNELSSTYSVRGGNFDENLVYVNNIPIYRPFLIRAGQQEGLSFINPDLVADVAFSSGGWQAKYGDKLSSSLNVAYKQPTRRRASLRAGLLGGSAHFEGATERMTFIAGVRHKSAQYLFNALETEGQYLPRFTDAQAYVTVDLDGDPERRKTELGALLSYANNRYLVRPESRETFFGTLQESFTLSVGYEG